MSLQTNNPATAATVNGALTSNQKNKPITPNSQGQAFSLTRVTATVPDRLTKTYRLSGNDLRQIPGGEMVSGEAEVLAVSSLEDFASLLNDLKPNQALTYGRPVKERVGLCTKRQWAESGRPEHTVPRSKESFAWPVGGGVMMLDYDPNGATLSRDQLIEAIKKAVPGLHDAGLVWRPSSSSHITNAETNEELKGLCGQRLWMLVDEAADIPRAGKAIESYLWAAGLGRIEVGQAGQQLKRTLVDTSVWQANRLDFAAGANCAHPLKQLHREPIVIAGATSVDTRQAIPEPDDSTLALAAQREREARSAAKGDADTARNEYVEGMALKLAGQSEDEGGLERARAVVMRALENHTLSADFPLDIEQGGRRVRVSVNEVLDQPLNFHGSLTLDPVEPEYNGGKTVGKLYLLGTRPRLYSFAHGGRTFSLTRHTRRIELVKGMTASVVDETLAFMRQAPDIFDFGGALVTVDGSKVQTLDRHALRYWMGGALQFWRLHQLPKGGMVEVLSDPPNEVADQILSLGMGRGLKQLQGVITAPTLRPDGSLLSQPGFDEVTGLLLELDADEAYPIPDRPNRAEVGKALERLMMPFSEFPLVGASDRGVLLAALLTAAVRPVLPTAPAFGFDAPTQGSGKTLLAKCVSGIAQGERAAIWPHIGGRDDEETRKRLMTILLSSSRAVVWDNVLGVFDSAALAGVLTSTTYNDRILGKTGASSVPNKALWLFTGNNLTLAGDMPRRVLKCRIDPESERPYDRRFNVEPESYCLANRQGLVADALTVVRGWLTSGGKPQGGSMASFEQWDSMVRQAVIWVSRELDDSCGDPLMAVIDAQASDPEVELLDSLITALETKYGANGFSAKDVKKVVDRCLDAARNSHYPLPSDTDRELFEVLCEFKPGRELTARGIGRILAFRTERVVQGRRLRKRQNRNVMSFFVECLQHLEVAA